MEVKIVSKSSVKPCSPTPQHLKTFKLSFLDQLNPSLYVPLLLYYYPDDETQVDDHMEKSEKLKLSLSQVLTHFYPLAGRITDNLSVQCSDQGAEFIQTHINNNLSDILKLPDPVIFQKLLPSVEARTGCLLAVQANFFRQGGVVIGICISHKIADASTLSLFINAWVGLTAQSPDIQFPVYGASAKFPPVDSLATLPVLQLPKTNCVTSTRRYVVNAAKMAALKSRAASESVANPTSVEAVSALIWKCAIKASRKHNYLMKVKPSVLGQSVNLRKRLDPPLPDSYVGNIASFFPARIEEDELAEIELQTLVSRLREGKYGLRHYIEQLSGEHGSMATCRKAAEYGGLLTNESLEFYGFTSWCRFPFYEADFGWGKPSWVSSVSSRSKNFVKLIDAPPGWGGIEAWVTLSEEAMAIFETDEELIQFAVLNPSIP